MSVPVDRDALRRMIFGRIMAMYDRFESAEKTREEIMAIVREHYGDVDEEKLRSAREMLDAFLEEMER